MKKICMLSGILLAMVITGVAVKVKKADIQQELKEEVFRFHVLANSDSQEDQALKMEVKEAIIAYMKEELPESESVDMTRQWALSNTEQIVRLAQSIVCEKGYDYPVHAEVTTSDFPDKTYGDVTLPAGTYEALRIEIGEAKGQNWWCVLYPNLCFQEAVHIVVPEGEKQTYEGINATTRFKVGWFFF